MTTTKTMPSSTGKLGIFKRFMIAMCLAFTVMGSLPSHARANIAGDDKEPYDARVQGYTPDVELKSGGVSMIYVVMFLMMIVCVSVMFIDAKRSHLD